jgi:hypothetical protein
MQLRKVGIRNAQRDFDGKITWEVANLYIKENDGRILLQKSLGK